MSTALICWSMGLITYATVVIYSGSLAPSGSVATIYASTTGILSIVTGYIQKRVSDLNDKICTRST